MPCPSPSSLISRTMYSAATATTRVAMAKKTPLNRKVTTPIPRARARPTTAPSATPATGGSLRVPTPKARAYPPNAMNTTWPKLTYPVRPVIRFKEYARVAEINRPIRRVRRKRGIHGADTPRRIRKIPMPQIVGPSERNAGSLIGGCRQAANKTAPHFSRTAEDHNDEADRRVQVSHGRVDSRREPDGQQGTPCHCDAESEGGADRSGGGGVDAREPRRRDVLTVGANRIPQVRLAQEDVRKADDGHGHDGHVEAAKRELEEAELKDSRAPWDPDVVSGPEGLDRVNHEEGETECCDERDHLALQAHRLLAPELAVEEHEVEEDADPQADGGINRDAQERIEPVPQVEPVRSVRAEHDELAVGHVHDLGDAPDQVQAVRDDREDTPEQQAEREVGEEQRRVGHAPPSVSRLRARVWILAGCVGDVARQDDLLRSCLPLDEEHRVRGLHAPRVELELPEEVHDVHAPQLGPHVGRVQAIRLLDRVRQDEEGRPGLAGVVRRGGTAVQGPVQLSELGRSGTVPGEPKRLGLRGTVADDALPLRGSRHIVCGGSELRLERGLRHRDQQRDEFRGRRCPGRLQLV